MLVKFTIFANELDVKEGKKNKKRGREKKKEGREIEKGRKTSECVKLVGISFFSSSFIEI